MVQRKVLHNRMFLVTVERLVKKPYAIHTEGILKCTKSPDSRSNMQIHLSFPLLSDPRYRPT